MDTPPFLFREEKDPQSDKMGKITVKEEPDGDLDTPPTLFREEEDPPSETTANNSPREIITQWKGQRVPMNEHSDKDALLYTDPATCLLFRFILHRKNNQKPDNYACARCKSKKKYVRILIAGDYFLEDPAALDHICYMTPEQLRNAREKSQEIRSKFLIKERQQSARRTRSLRARESTDSAAPALSMEQFDVSRLEHETPLFPVATIARLFEDPDLQAPPEIRPISPLSSFPGCDGEEEEEEEEEDDDDYTNPAPSTSAAYLDSLIKQHPIPDERPPVLRKRPSTNGNVASTIGAKQTTPIGGVKRPRHDEQMRSEAEPRDSSSGPSDVFTASLRRAMDGLKPQFRARAENEVLRFVYSKLYEKYAS